MPSAFRPGARGGDGGTRGHVPMWLLAGEGESACLLPQQRPLPRLGRIGGAEASVWLTGEEMAHEGVDSEHLCHRPQACRRGRPG